MKYKVGDKIKIKTWDQLLSEFGGTDDMIECPHGFMDQREKMLIGKCPDRVLEILFVNDDMYEVRENLGGFSKWWTDDMIEHEESTSDKESISDLLEMINSRFEILDL